MDHLELIESNGTITEGWRTIELFTNRHTVIRQFLTYLNEETPQNRILFFSGDGGNGKSLLLRVLREQYCLRILPTNWEWLNERFKRDKEFVEEVKSALATERVTAASLEFGMQPQAESRPLETMSGLLMLRRSLGRQGLHFPLFDFACLCYLDKTRGLNPAHLASLFPAEEMDFITSLADVLLEKSWIMPIDIVLKLVGKHLRKEFTFYKAERKLDGDSISKIRGMEPYTELIQALPGIFALDLNAMASLRGRDKRVVLFSMPTTPFGAFKETCQPQFSLSAMNGSGAC